MDSPRRSTTNRSRSISITTRRASASSSSQVMDRGGARRSRAHRHRRPTATRPTATRLIDHATDRDPRNITTLTVPLAPILSFPVTWLEDPRTSRSIAGRYRPLPIRVLPQFLPFVFFPAWVSLILLHASRLLLERVASASRHLSPITSRHTDSPVQFYCLRDVTVIFFGGETTLILSIKRTENDT